MVFKKENNKKIKLSESDDIADKGKNLQNPKIDIEQQIKKAQEETEREKRLRVEAERELKKERDARLSAERSESKGEKDFRYTKKLNYNQILIDENFESYKVNTFPSSGGWILKYDGAGKNYQVVSKANYISGEKSMQVKGARGWSAIMYKNLSSTPSIIFFEGWMKTSGVDGGMGFGNRDERAWGTGYAEIKFCQGELCCYLGGMKNYMQDYQKNVWYKVKIKFDSANKYIDVWVNDVLKVSNYNKN